MAFLELRDIKKSFQVAKHELQVLKGVSLSLDFGQWTTLLGASGSGKTTLLDIIGTISVPDGGTLSIDTIEPFRLSSSKLVTFRREYIGFVFQSYHLLPEFTILENVMLPMLLAGDSRRDAKKLAEHLIETVGMSHRLNHRPNELSGGEQQRTAIARAITNRPKLLLADEPTGNLDTRTGEGVLDLFEQIRTAGETTILMVTHDERIASRADRVVRISDGKAVTEEKR